MPWRGSDAPRIKSLLLLVWWVVSGDVSFLMTLFWVVSARGRATRRYEKLAGPALESYRAQITIPLVWQWVSKLLCSVWMFVEILPLFLLNSSWLRCWRIRWTKHVNKQANDRFFCVVMLEVAATPGINNVTKATSSLFLTVVNWCCGIVLHLVSNGILAVLYLVRMNAISCGWIAELSCCSMARLASDHCNGGSFFNKRGILKAASGGRSVGYRHANLRWCCLRLVAAVFGMETMLL